MTLRVRPARIAVLINRNSEPSAYINAVRFLSQIWGGRYAPIIDVDGEQADPLTVHRLSELRPEFVYGVDISEPNWREAVLGACQPRMFRLLSQVDIDDTRNAQREKFIHGDRALVQMFRDRNERSRFNRHLNVVSTDYATPIGVCCAAAFGIHHPQLFDEYRDETREIGSGDQREFIDLCVDQTNNRKQTWLDANAYGLIAHHLSTQSKEPTIVLVQKLIPDLTLFWNKRMISDHDEPAWTIPILADQANCQEVLGGLNKWLERFNPFSTFCNVTSQSVPESECLIFAEKLKEGLRNTTIEHIDYEPPRNHLPIIYAIDSTVTWPITIEGQKLEFIPPKPTSFEIGEDWYVDILHEVSTDRAPLEMDLPATRINCDLLNGPCPPTFEHSVIRRTGLGVDAINIRCDSGKGVVRLYVPTSVEILEECMRQKGFEPIHDEKRSSYLPTIERFGGLYQAARSFTGKSREIINSLLKGPAIPNKIRGLCELGGRELPIIDYLGRLEASLQHESDLIKRIAKRRYMESAQGEIPEQLTLNALMEHWADRSILKRRWRLGPCRKCRQRWFSGRLAINQPITCPSCGNSYSLPEKLEIAYGLAPAIRHSLKEGIIPIALTGRFLRNMTNHGYFWLPGMKWKRSEERGYIDIIACCDGYFVFAECKTLSDIEDESFTWKAVLDQFIQLSNMAIECGAALVVFASQVEKYPLEFSQEIDEKLKSKISYLLLNREELDKGRRGEKWSSIRDFLPYPFPEAQIKSEGGLRQIKFGSITYTKGPSA
jgi:hypothetical protein